MAAELFDAEVMEAAVPIPERKDLFLVIACGDKVWAMPSTMRGLFVDQDAAVKAANRLSSYWHHVRIVRIPGEKGHLSGEKGHLS